MNQWVVISGKVNFYKKKYQITNPSYVVPVEKEEFVKKVMPKYSLTEGISEKVYRNIIEQVLVKLPELPEWHNPNTLGALNNKRWKDSVLYLHNPKNKHNQFSPSYKRMDYSQHVKNNIILPANLRPAWGDFEMG